MQMGNLLPSLPLFLGKNGEKHWGKNIFSEAFCFLLKFHIDVFVYLLDLFPLFLELKVMYIVFSQLYFCKSPVGKVGGQRQ